MTDRVSLQIAAVMPELPAVYDFIDQAAAGLALALIFDLRLAVEEAVSNIIEHGYQGRPGLIDIEIERRAESIIVRLRDAAPFFDPTAVLVPELIESLFDQPLGGAGLLLIEQTMDKMSYRALPGGGNELTLVKQIVDMEEEE